jgi:hypothetical protein
MTAGVQAQIQTEHLLNASLERCCYANSLDHICSSQGNKSHSRPAPLCFARQEWVDVGNSEL